MTDVPDSTHDASDADRLDEEEALGTPRRPAAEPAHREEAGDPESATIDADESRARRDEEARLEDAERGGEGGSY